MTSLRLFTPLATAAILLGLTAGNAVAQHQFELVTGKAFDSALPKDFYLEGNAIPTAKRNAVMVHTPSGARALFSLLDTTGYASNIIEKYVGMIITEGDVSICGQKVTVGSYGFGWVESPGGTDQPGKFSLYDQAGGKLAECATPRDAALKSPRPLQVVVKKDGTAILYHGRNSVELK
ncbi:MAG: hypothetical protein ABSH47_11080 [Bryobacteraceae bacterium]|jgi:hypothetical protein